MINFLRSLLIGLAMAGVGVGVIACADQSATDSPAFVRESVASLQPAATLPTDTEAPQQAGSALDEQLFLATLDAEGINYGIAETGINMGYAVCDYLATGATALEAGTLIADEGFYSHYEAGYIVGAATTALCPEWS